ncbi:Bax inhibitor-1/YccA family protein [Lactobacillus gallinarum]|uniref:Bax inhibitor-1/YccA family protein n=1 Tax=Lactobacillus gallinarum TaxID=52242 RepID=UPI00195E7A02|nr:Bax inhibitor-1/YccA family protein [Lactobacillus gallinarum]MBM6972430.1 Bax inhibitor-1/YccA family protein [Lactobacillus gallinarum]
MDNMNFSSPERRQVHDVSEVNGFLSKMYGYMGLAVLVSAITAFLTMTVFRAAVMQMPTALMWIILIVPLGLSMGISFRATRNPVAGFVMLMILAVIYGFEFALLAGFYTGTQISTAFLSSTAVFGAMAIFGTFTKRDLNNLGSYMGAALIGLLVAMIVNIFLRNSVASFVFSIIGVIIFTGLTAYDAQKMKSIYNNYGSQVPTNGLAVLGALQLYLDFINIFLFLLQIFGMGNDRN